MSTPPPAARLHVLLARESPMALVIRRGPSKATCMIGWDRRDDAFTVGQWLKGRIYERRSDISPDGRHWIYFAMDGHWDGEANGSWTAIAQVPYLKAIGLFAKGDGWFGGGLFVNATSVWINGDRDHRCLHYPRGIGIQSEQPFEALVSGECPGVYFPRLVRDGWRHVRNPETPPEPAAAEVSVAWTGSVPPVEKRTVFEKDAPEGWLLRKAARVSGRSRPGRGVYFDEHQMVHRRNGRTIDLPDWEWADMDRERLVYAEKGCLYTVKLSPAGLGEPRLLHDFNGMTFEPIAAPY